MGQSVARVATSAADVERAAVLLHAFNVEYDDPRPEPLALAARLTTLVAAGEVVVLLAAAGDGAAAEGVAVLRIQPSVWSEAPEAYLAELYVSPASRGLGLGRALLQEFEQVARSAGADYAFVITSETDIAAQHAYRAAGFRTTEGEGGPQLVAFERDL